MIRLALPPLALLLGAAAAELASGAEPAPEPRSGRELFREQCGGCHLETGFATRILARRVPPGQALLEQRVGLDAELVRVVVRRGIGSMPQIRRTELSDSELELIARYLEDAE